MLLPPTFKKSYMKLYSLNPKVILRFRRMTFGFIIGYELLLPEQGALNWRLSVLQAILNSFLPHQELYFVCFAVIEKRNSF